ncbi:MAG: ADOP family duplicated permease [Terriglobales bacterium]
MSWLGKLGGWPRRRRREAEWDEELRQHIERRAAANEAEGLSAAAARRAARLAFGGFERHKEAVREAHRLAVVEDFARDLRYGARRLARAPAFTLAMVVLLALGVGAVVAMYSLGRALEGGPVGLPHPERLWMIGQAGLGARVAPANFRDLQRMAGGVLPMAAFSGGGATVRVGGAVLRAEAVRVGPRFFAVLGAAPAVGRGFLATEFLPGGGGAAIVTARFQREHFAGAAIGAPIEVNGRPATVVGVMPAGVDFPLQNGVILPLVENESWWQRRKAGDEQLNLLARLPRGMQWETAQAALATAAARLAQAHPEADGKLRFTWNAPAEVVNGNLTPIFVGLLLAATGLLLALAIANLANLQLGQALRRRQEVALRAALGATRGRLARQFLAESLLLALGGGAAAVAAAAWALRLLFASMPPSTTAQMIGWERMGLDRGALALALGLALGGAALAALAPAWLAAGHAAADGLREMGRGGSGRRGHRLRGALVVAQMALGLALVATAATTAGGFAMLAATARHYGGEHALSFRLDLPSDRYTTPAAQSEFLRRLLARLRALPGVEAAGAGTSLPLTNGDTPERWAPVSLPGEKRTETWVLSQAVSADYLAALRLPLAAGRGFSEADSATAPGVAIVSANLAARLWPGRNALGRRLEFNANGAHPGRMVEVVGVAASADYNVFNRTPELAIYWPLAQAAAGDARLLGAETFVLRTAGDPEALATAVRGAVAGLDPTLPAFQMWTLAKYFGVERAPLRILGGLFGAFGALALLIAAVGLYAAMAASAAERQREMGIRVALGADAGGVVRLGLARALKLAGLGLAIGFPLAIYVGRLLAGFVYGLAPIEGWLLAGVALTLAATAVLAGYLPARRAGRMDPVAVLRCE